MRDALPEQHGVLLAVVPLLGLGQNARGFSRQANVRLLADAELLQPVVPLFFGESAACHHGSGVHGPPKDAGKGALFSAVLERVSERLPIDGVGRWGGEVIQGERFPLLDHGCGGNHLLHGTGFVGGCH
ncbi:hypothetical protein D3C73_1012660 [compost metagenome]